MYEYIDIHAHLDMKDFAKDREDLIETLRKEKIAVITVGVDKKSSLEAVALAEKYENIYATIGYHPTDADESFEADDFSNLSKKPKVVGVGECGLDFFSLKDNSDFGKKKQKDLFISQIDFAGQADKPLMIHCRDAHREVLEILSAKKREWGEKLRGNIHFFSGNLETAKKYLALDFTLSFGGVITFSRDYDEVVKFMPLDRLMSETDAPFVAPVPYRGQRNSPLFVKEVVKKIAEIKQLALSETKQVLVKNAKEFFLL